MTDLADKLAEVANGLLDDLLRPGNEIAWDQRIDAFKAISAYHLGLRRQSDKDSKPDGDPDAPGFAKWRAAANGGAVSDA